MAGVSQALGTLGLVVVLKEIRSKLEQVASKEDATNLQRYFKTGPGEYGEGDRFLGVRVGPLRKLAKQYRTLPFSDVESLINSAYHEERMLALLILVEQFQRGAAEDQKRIFNLYLHNLRNINNWDLVDISAPRIVGGYLREHDRKRLYSLARSPHLWSRRVAMMATLFFISHDDFDDSLKIADLLLNDKHDLIHKAVGWMLREVGNRDRQVEEKFLKSRYKNMPRTMLRYAIEKFPPARRKRYLDGRI
ncbi:MAG: DNA alkylation repair protein [Acidiferrobacterales bacterium]|nr:DNA alkylation repair protein [Acidiferrobacterales bacterium]